MVNEELENFLFSRLKKYVTKVKVVDKVGEIELYVPFRLREIDTLPFMAEVDGYSFKQIELIFKVASWDKKVIKTTIIVDLPVEKVYPMTVGIGAGYFGLGSNFGPILPLMDPTKLKQKIKLEEAIQIRQDEKGTTDMLSGFLNKKFDTNKMLSKDLKPNFQVQDGNWVTTFYDRTNLFISPSDEIPNSIKILYSVFRGFNPKKDNFFPKLDLSKIFKYFEEIYSTYKEFIGRFDFSRYPVDPFLNGPESFICKRCESMIFPQNALIWKYGNYFFLTLDSICPNCMLKRKMVAPQEDERILEAANDFFWVCPNDLTPYRIIKEDEKSGVIKYELFCETCKRPVKKEIDLQYMEILELGKGKPSPKLALDGTFVDYQF